MSHEESCRCDLSAWRPACVPALNRTKHAVHFQEIFRYVKVLTSVIIPFQVKFSELTLDMFRMLQALEREPEDAPSRTLVTSTEVDESPDDKVSHTWLH